jgi:hypothetical protein
MPSSYEKINYALRPAKSVERKMLCDAFRRLSGFARLETYRYIGFGSTYFSDFVLVHKSLGITNMMSIERDVDVRERFEFNCPFACVRIVFEESTDALADLKWDPRTILWLDYDNELNDQVLADTMLFCASAPSGSMLVITVDARAGGDPSLSARKVGKQRLAALQTGVGQAKVPADVTGKHLAGSGTAKVYRRIIDNQIVDTLVKRNATRDPGSKMLYKQLFYFHYADTAMMMTVGGLLYDEGESNRVDYCSFGGLDFIRTGDDPYHIQVPSLTYREIRHLDKQLPIDDWARLQAAAIPQDDLERYSRVYRYFPTFAETDV